MDVLTRTRVYFHTCWSSVKCTFMCINLFVRQITLKCFHSMYTIESQISLSKDFLTETGKLHIFKHIQLLKSRFNMNRGQIKVSTSDSLHSGYSLHIRYSPHIRQKSLRWIKVHDITVSKKFQNQSYNLTPIQCL